MTAVAWAILFFAGVYCEAHEEKRDPKAYFGWFSITFCGVVFCTAFDVGMRIVSMKP